MGIDNKNTPEYPSIRYRSPNNGGIFRYRVRLGSWGGYFLHFEVNGTIWRFWLVFGVLYLGTQAESGGKPGM